MIVEVEAGDGGAPFKVVRGPVQFNHEPLETTRAPQASEHTEIVLMELGHGLGPDRGAQGFRRHRLSELRHAVRHHPGLRPGITGLIGESGGPPRVHARS